MIAFRKKHDTIRRHTAACSFGFPELSAHDIIPWKSAFNENSHYIGILYAGHENHRDDCVYLAVNTYWEPLAVTLPKLPQSMCWYKVVDTYEEESVMNPECPTGDKVTIRERSVMIFRMGHLYE
jgi:glycogen operon protein